MNSKVSRYKTNTQKSQHYDCKREQLLGRTGVDMPINANL